MAYSCGFLSSSRD